MSTNSSPTIRNSDSAITISSNTSPQPICAAERCLSSLRQSPLSLSCLANDDVTRAAQDESKINVAQTKPVLRSLHDSLIHEQSQAALRDRLLEEYHQRCYAADLQASHGEKRQRREQLYPDGMTEDDVIREEFEAEQTHSEVLECERTRSERLERHRREAERYNDSAKSVELPKFIKPSELYTSGYHRYDHHDQYQGELWETSPYQPGQPGFGFRRDGIPLGSSYIDHMRNRNTRFPAGRVLSDPMQGRRRRWVNGKLSKPEERDNTSILRVSKKSRTVKFVRPMTEAQDKLYKKTHDKILQEAKRAKAERVNVESERILRRLDRC